MIYTISISKEWICVKRATLRNAPERIRTLNPQIRSLMLYPVELRALKLSIILPEQDKKTSYREPI